MMGAYADAGVDVAAADALVGRIAPAVTATWGEGVVGTFGGFAAGVRIPAGYQHPVLAMTTDGVGTKAEVARMAGRVEGLGHDLVAMCVDDLAAAGVRPLAMTDYLAVGSLDHVDVEGIVRSIARACGEAGVALIGGETAVHPDVMAENGFDLAGAAVGVVEDGQQVDGTRIVAGDAIVGVASPNLRSNGFSLLRSRVLPNVSMGGVVPGTDASWTDLVLAPSVIYSPAVAAVIEAVAVHGLAHITGGGLRGNVPRILPVETKAVIHRRTWRRPEIFAAITDVTGLAGEELFGVFNMGIGFVAVVAPQAAAEAIDTFASHGHEAWVIGEVTHGTPSVDLRS